MDIRVTGLARDLFEPLFGLATAELAGRGIERIVVDSSPGYPDRISLDDAPVGESVLLLNYMHQPADTPFRASHAIYVREQARERWDRLNEVPPALARRLIALRAFDASGHMVAAELGPGEALLELARPMLDDVRVAYLQAHYAKWGCYAARVERA
jgi:hypothetical protein